MARRAIIKDGTQTIESYARSRQMDSPVWVQPAAAQCRVRSGGAPSGDFAACTVDATSAVLTSQAAEGDTSLAINTASAISRGRRYVLELPSGEQFWVRASDDVSSGNPVTVPLSSPLPCAVPVGSTLFGCSLRRVLTSTETSTVGPLVVDWRVTLPASAVSEWTEQFEVVRRVALWVLDEEELIKRMPEALALRDQSDVSLSETIDAALEEELLPRLRGKRGPNGEAISEHGIVSTWPLVPAHVAAVRLLLTMQDRRRTKEDRDEARADLEAKVSLALNDADAWFDAPQEDAAVTPPLKPTNYSARRYVR